MQKGSFRMSCDGPSSISGNSDDGLLNLMVSSLSPARTSRPRPSGSRRRRSPASLMIYVVGSERGPSLLPSFFPRLLLRPGVRKNARSSAKTELAPSLQIRPTSLLNPEEDAVRARRRRPRSRALSKTGHFHNKESHARPFREIRGQWPYRPARAGTRPKGNKMEPITPKLRLVQPLHD